MSAKNWVYFLAIVVIAAVVFNKYLFYFNYLPWGDITTFYFPKYQMIRESVFSYKSIPLWDPYFMGGQPHFPVPSNSTFFSLFGWLILFFSAAYTVKLNLVLSILLGGVGAYWLANYLTKSQQAAFIAGIIYMFNGYMLKSFVWGWITAINGYALIPFVVLFLVKAHKEHINYVLLSAALLALLFYSDGGLITQYALLAAALFLIVFLSLKNAVKIALVASLLFIIFFGLISFRILPSLEYIENSGRSYTWEELRHSRNIEPKMLFKSAVSSFGIQKEDWNNIGVLPFILALFTLPLLRKKTVLYFWLLIIISVLIATGSYFVYLFWRFVPGWTHMRYLDRALILFVFASSILAAYGFVALIKLIKRKSHRHVVFFGIVVIAMAELTLGYNLIGYGEPMLDIYNVVDENQIMNFVADQPGVFRIYTIETRGIDYATQFVSVPLRLESLFGYESVWDRRYLNVYLGDRNAIDAMNVRYITSMSPLNETSFGFIKKFEKSDYMFKREGIQKIQGPYLYENENAMPRAYFINASILVLDSTEAKDGFKIHSGYSLLKSNLIDTRNAALVFGEISEKYDYDLFGCIILFQLDEKTANLLQSYNGLLVPDFRKGQNQMSEEDILQIKSTCETGQYIPIEDRSIITSNFNKKTVNLNSKYSNGFLVLSEKYSLYDWKSSIGKIYQTNGVLSGVYIDKPVDEVVFEYKPDSIRKGRIITVITIIITVGILLFPKIKTLKNTKIK